MESRHARYLGYRITPSITLHPQVIGYLLSPEDLSQSTFDLRHRPDQLRLHEILHLSDFLTVGHLAFKDS